MKKTKPTDAAYSVIKKKIPGIVNGLMNLPTSHIWLHEKVLSKLLKIPAGDKFGPRHALTIIVRGIEKGYCGNRRNDYVNTGYTITDFSKEKSDHPISFQKYGKMELFAGGKLDDSVYFNPWWFKSGDEITDIRTQNQIVDELLGESPSLSEEVEDYRQNNCTCFFKDVDQEGGYRKYDVPTIAYHYRDIWGRDITVDENYVKDGYVRHHAFKPGDLD